MKSQSRDAMESVTVEFTDFVDAGQGKRHGAPYAKRAAGRARRKTRRVVRAAKQAWLYS